MTNASFLTPPKRWAVEINVSISQIFIFKNRFAKSPGKPFV